MSDFLYKFYLNDKELKVQDGFVYNEKATEELDSLTIVVPFTPKLNINPYDFARIDFEQGGGWYFVVDTYNEETCDFDNELYNYTIHLISETVLLDKVRLPNRKFTPLNNRSVLWQCEELIKYANKRFKNRFTFSNAFRIKFDGIKGVEKQFNKPTCREALNELVRIDDCIIKVSNGVIDYVKLDAKGYPIDTSKIFLNNDSQNANEYASILRMDAENCQSESSNVYVEFLNLRTDNSPILTEENLSLITQHPIDQVSELIAYVPYTSGDIEYVKGFNITNRIVEKEIYDLLRIGNFTSPNEEKKIYNMYYVRHSNKIEGLNYSEKILNLFDGKMALEMIIDQAFLSNNVNYSKIDYISIRFTITYKSTEAVSFIKEKEKKYNTPIELTDNQIDNYINLDLFGKSEQEKVNRLGNKYKIITGIYNNISEVPRLFNNIDDFILAEREIVFYNDYFQFKGTLYQNYIFENMFYGVNAKRRSYAIESGDKAVLRQEIVYRKLIFSSDYLYDSDVSNIARHLLMQIAGNTIPAVPDADGFGGEETMKLLSGRRMMTTKITSMFSDRTNSNIYRLTPYCSICDNALLVNLRWYDNYSVGMHQVGNVFESLRIGGIAQDYCRYVDNNGELVGLNIRLYDWETIKLNDTKYDFIDATKTLPLVRPQYESFFYDSKNLADSFYLSINKDSQEIPNITIQYEIKGNDNIIITDNMIEAMLLNYKYLGINFNSLFVAYSTSETYDKDAKTMVSSSVIITDGSVEIDYTDLKNYLLNNVAFNKIKLYNNNVSMVEWKSWALVSNSGKLYMAVNRVNGVLPTTIYLNEEEEN